MRFKLDENLPQDLAQDLQNLGHDSDSVITENLAGQTIRLLFARQPMLSAFC